MSDVGKVEYALNQSQRQAIADWLTKKWKSSACPYCQESQWVIPLYIVPLHASPVNSIGDPNLGSPLYPTLPIACANCGHLAFVNGLLIEGIVPKGGTDAEA